MSRRAVHWISLILVLVSATAAMLLAGWLGEVAGVAAPFALAIALAITGLAAIAAWLLQEFAWLRPLDALEREVRLQMHGNPERTVQVPDWHGLGMLPAALVAQGARSRDANDREVHAVAEARAAADVQRVRLEAVLSGLADGIIGCTADRRILLFNEAARRLLDAPPELGLDRPLDRLFASGPIRQVFNTLRRRADAGATPVSEPFVCASADGARLFRCRLTLFGTTPEQGFVLDFAPAPTPGGPGDALEVMRTVRALRGSAGSLLAAAEIIGRSDLEPERREAFVAAIGPAGEALCTGFERLEAAVERLGQGAWPEADFLSSDLTLQVGHLLEEEERPIDLVPVGRAVWMRGDAVHLALLVEHLLSEIAGHTGTATFDFTAVADGARIRLELAFAGPPIQSALLDAWLGEGVPDAVGILRFTDVVERHGGEVWSDAGSEGGRATVRILLPRAEREASARTVSELPPRPEFYDFDLMVGRDVGADVRDRALRALTFVVFDTETTGLEPARDRIVQIAAVRIVNRRLLAGETFECLVDPGRPIPRSSIRFHGITDEMVRGRPPIEVVLPRFHAFCEGAVLVAHNAAFDLAFLRQAEVIAGVAFDHPVLDTLLISAVLHDHVEAHGLDAVAERFGIAPRERHQARGDALTTAEIFLRMIDLLEDEGVRTLGEALALAARATRVRKQQAEAFAGRPAGRSVVIGDG